MVKHLMKIWYWLIDLFKTPAPLPQIPKFTTYPKKARVYSWWERPIRWNARMTHRVHILRRDHFGNFSAMNWSKIRREKS